MRNFPQLGVPGHAAATYTAALDRVAQADHLPDLIVSDYYLSEGKPGFDIVEALRAALSAEIPAFLISGDTNPTPPREAKAKGFHLLHKPVDPTTLRAMFNRAVVRTS